MTYFTSPTETCRGEQRSKRKWVKGADLNVDDHIGRQVLGRCPLQAQITLIREWTPEKAWTPSQAG